MDRLNKAAADTLNRLTLDVLDGCPRYITTTHATIIVKLVNTNTFSVEQCPTDDQTHVFMTFWRVNASVKVDGMILHPGDWIPLSKDNGIASLGIEIRDDFPYVVNDVNHEQHLNFADTWLPKVMMQKVL